MMNKQERIKYCEDKIEEIKSLDVEIIKGDIDSIMKASQDTDSDRMIETIDYIVDDYFKINFKTNKEQEFELEETIEGIKIFDIGNGLKGYEYNNQRCVEMNDLEKIINDEEMWELVEYRI